MYSRVYNVSKKKKNEEYIFFMKKRCFFYKQEYTLIGRRTKCNFYFVPLEKPSTFVTFSHPPTLK